ncbi:hypothetical protein ACW0TQ_10420 [Oceanobacillus sp. M60]|uniref:hypothetical protein n=1 Tax=Oceanobacillus sp. FSL K6-0251 TaxID=2921602 RepID=UPI0030F8AB7B
MPSYATLLQNEAANHLAGIWVEPRRSIFVPLYRGKCMLFYLPKMKKEYEENEK